MSQEVQIKASYMVEDMLMDSMNGSCKDIWPFEICNIKKKEGKCVNPYKLSGHYNLYVYDKCMKTCGEC